MPRPETCSRCGEEVRYGTRYGAARQWLHRIDSDHVPTFGRLFTAEDQAEAERQRHIPRTRERPDGSIETYTTAEHDARKIKNLKKREAALAELEDDEEEEGHEIEPIEVRCMDLPHKGRVFVGYPDGPPAEAKVPGGVRTVLNLCAKIGWTVDRLTYSRGPFLAANGKSLGVSDSVVLRIRGPVVDGKPLQVLASWRDCKSLWAWQIQDGKAQRASGIKVVIAWMKENPNGES